MTHWTQEEREQLSRMGVRFCPCMKFATYNSDLTNPYVVKHMDEHAIGRSGILRRRSALLDLLDPPQKGVA